MAKKERVECDTFASGTDRGNVPFFSPERNSWLALELEDSDPCLTVDLTGYSCRVPDCSFVDDLMSATSTLAGLKKKADMMAAISCIIRLRLSRAKLKVFCMD